nr:hypothetical protein Iba_chr14dCG1870 [Ipomoea batatas]GMD89628.1 hypothetical protein Iba_chr14dCG1880 [Ipomoea batatas]
MYQHQFVVMKILQLIVEDPVGVLWISLQGERNIGCRLVMRRASHFSGFDQVVSSLRVVAFPRVANQSWVIVVLCRKVPCAGGERGSDVATELSLLE